jgi:hypothetical protein
MRIWFQRKTFGWGWTPSTWQGWVVTLVYVLTVIFIFHDIDENAHSASDTLIHFVVPFLAITLIFLWIVYKTGEKPEWRWGGKNKKN